ncbi:hypothetical protein MLD38_021249 [Melastoma candidum]|uniref:Uncharacterized protein n=1 Tax=Melastoma candidum TaxID=119954 RepID=A0ACB9QFS2_9MYRT|nr:hypothetical protein MLD38_021249 [Melastoma candidum]
MVLKDEISQFSSDESYYDWGRIIDTSEFVESYLLEDEKLGMLFSSNPGLLFSGAGKNVYVLICQLLKVGIKMEEVRLLFTDNMHLVTEKCLKNFSGRLSFLDELRLDAGTIARAGDQSFYCLLESGLDYNAVTSMVKQVPPILNQSRDVLEKKINFLANRLHYPVEELEVFLAYLCHDMERIVRRIFMLC